jgi:hypothetical protein
MALTDIQTKSLKAKLKRRWSAGKLACKPFAPEGADDPNRSPNA